MDSRAGRHFKRSRLSPRTAGRHNSAMPDELSGDANSRERNVTSVQDNAQRVGAKDLPGQVVLVLQGGGALGSYQAGVYQALHEAGLEPDWVSGVSIGAINGAIIAGNPPALRLQRLRTFWERITERKIWNYTPDGDVFRRTRNA